MRLLSIFVFLLAACTTVPHAPLSRVSESRSLSSVSNSSGVFPAITRDANGLLLKAVRAKIAKGAVPAEEFDRVAILLRNYFLFLGLTAQDFTKAGKIIAEPVTEAAPVQKSTKNLKPEDAESADEESDGTASNLGAIARVFASSIQYLECGNLQDWTCLETDPVLKPSAKFRLPIRQGLGEPVRLRGRLDMDVFFTQAWDGKTPRAQVAEKLAERLSLDATKRLSLAMYGINGINDSMKPVYDAILDHVRSPDINVRAVVDVAGFEKTPEPWIMTYTEPSVLPPETSHRWIFGAPPDNTQGMNALFQYDGTPALIREMNFGIKYNQDSSIRIEWPTANIMHNKFAVLEKSNGEKSVWSGTANFSDTCMGREINANMSIYIRNDQIAQAFLDQFNLMFNFDPRLTVKSKLVVGEDGLPLASGAVGRFHHNKYPISQRFFQFEDGTNVRVHFAPTDDAEHRVILPMLLSAQAGDIIRISMFGGTGFEIVRALQYAQAKGANVRIVFDAQLGRGTTSWIRDPALNLKMQNPYLSLVSRGGKPAGKIEVRMSTWAGKNHYKAGTLSRRQSDGSYLVESLIVGSQNWSSGGNDKNDENLVSFQNILNGVKAGELFNAEFDSHLWRLGRPEVGGLTKKSLEASR